MLASQIVEIYLKYHAQTMYDAPKNELAPPYKLETDSPLFFKGGLGGI